MRNLPLTARSGAAVATCVWVAAVGSSFCPTAVCAEPPDALDVATKPAPLPVLQIGPLNNKGGAEIKDPDGTPLFSRFVRALAFALKAEQQLGPLPFVVEARDAVIKSKPLSPAPKPTRIVPPMSLPRPVARFHLDGELSVSGPNGPYLCVLRLRDTANPNQVVAQWAGVAQTLRDLTGNLQRDSRVHSLGLAGEFARRVSGTTRGMLAPPPTTKGVEEAFKRIDSAFTKRLVVEEVPVESAKPGTAFRLRVSSQDAGDVYVFALNKQNQPVAAFEQKNPPVVLPDRPVLLPTTNEPLSSAAGRANQTFIVVVVRRADIAAGLEDTRMTENTPPIAVMVLDGSAIRPPATAAAADPLFARLMALLHTKKAEEILSARLIVGTVK